MCPEEEINHDRPWGMSFVTIQSYCLAITISPGARVLLVDGLYISLITLCPRETETQIVLGVHYDDAFSVVSSNVLP